MIHIVTRVNKIVSRRKYLEVIYKNSKHLHLDPILLSLLMNCISTPWMTI